MGDCGSDCFGGGAVASRQKAYEVVLTQIAVNSESGMLKTHKLSISVDATVGVLLVGLEKQHKLTRPHQQLFVLNSTKKVLDRSQKINSLYRNHQQGILQLFVESKQMVDSISGLGLEKINQPAGMSTIPQKPQKPSHNLYVILESKSGILDRRVEKVFDSDASLEKLLQECENLLKKPAISIDVWSGTRQNSIIITNRKLSLSQLTDFTKDTVHLWLEKRPSQQIKPVREDSVSSLLSDNCLRVKLQSESGVLTQRLELSVQSDKTVGDVLAHLSRQQSITVARNLVVVKDSQRRPVSEQARLIELSPNFESLTLFLERR